MSTSQLPPDYREAYGLIETQKVLRRNAPSIVTDPEGHWETSQGILANDARLQELLSPGD